MPNVHTPTGHLIVMHGAERIPLLRVAAYNAELRDEEGFIGDRASVGAFRSILDDWRARLRKVGEDPLGDLDTHAITKKKLDRILQDGDPQAAGLIHATVEDFAQQLSAVAARFLRQKAWKDAKRIVLGGGLRASRVGELAIGRASVILKAAGHAVDLVPIRYHPDQAGLIGTVHLVPSWIFAGFDGVLAVDIGGSNIRVGIVDLHLKKARDLSAVRVYASELWKHADEKPKRGEAVERLITMLVDLVERAHRQGISLAPFIGVGCPGVIEQDGTIDHGGQNLPGNWESSRFNLPQLIRVGVPKIGGHPTHVVMHNDAVVQGLSEAPFMRDVDTWGVLTIGTGLGNACFVNVQADA
ncbi:MAG: ROK family protein [Myxococcota bacterium]|nr:ROK family protein [Myxococcota bacterium]